jgi:hypothetical protein
MGAENCGYDLFDQVAVAGDLYPLFLYFLELSNLSDDGACAFLGAEPANALGRKAAKAVIAQFAAASTADRGSNLLGVIDGDIYDDLVVRHALLSLKKNYILEPEQERCYAGRPVYFCEQAYPPILVSGSILHPCL